MNNIIIFIITLVITTPFFAQEDALFIKEIHNNTLTEAHCYDNLRELCNLGGRLAGSETYDDAVQLVKSQLEKLKVDTVILQPCQVMGWDRGIKEKVYIKADPDISLSATSLGNSIGTGKGGLDAEVIEVHSLDEIEKLGKKAIEGKIVFFNRPLDPTHIRTFSAYGGAVDQRVYGASRAARYGAVATLIRSMTLNMDNVPHTGTLRYEEGTKQIPSLAISTMAAERLSDLLKKQSVVVHIENNCRPTEIKTTHSVIGELKGSEFPDEIIVVGGHLDAWDIGQGAHDDGAGCVQSIQVLETLLALGYRPKRTIRCVLFANEENGLAGGLEYAAESNRKGEFHLAALESDAGGFSPRGFSFDGHEDIKGPYYKRITEWLPLFESLGLQFNLGGSGADISPLKSQKGILIGLRPDSQRYFDFHHTDQDVFEAVNKRELELGAAAMTSLIYMIDQYGLEE